MPGLLADEVVVITRKPRKGDRLTYGSRRGTVTEVHGRVAWLRDEESKRATCFIWSFSDGSTNTYFTIVADGPPEPDGAPS